MRTSESCIGLIRAVGLMGAPGSSPPLVQSRSPWWRLPVSIEVSALTSTHTGMPSMRLEIQRRSLAAQIGRKSHPFPRPRAAPHRRPRSSGRAGL